MNKVAEFLFKLAMLIFILSAAVYVGWGVPVVVLISCVAYKVLNKANDAKEKCKDDWKEFKDFQEWKNQNKDDE